MFPQIPLLQLGDYKAEQVQKNIVLPLNTLLQIPFLSGVLLQNIALTTTEKSIPHGLERAYAGFLITKQNANAVIWISSTANNTQFLNLTASAAVTVDIWVF